MGHLGNNAEGSEEVDSVAAFIRVGDKLGIELLVAGEADATGRLVLSREKLVVSVINLLDVREGSAAHAVKPVLVNANEAITIDVNSLKVVGNETLEGSREISIGLAAAIVLDSKLELFNCDLAVLVEVSELSDLIPEVTHDFQVSGVGFVAEETASFNEGGAEGQAHEVILVKVAVVVNVVHVPDDELDAVIPGVSHGTEF